MSLQASLGKYQTELADAASRTFRASANAPARTTTPKPKPVSTTSHPAVESAKRTHDAAFSSPLSAGSAGSELLTQVHHAQDKLKQELVKGTGIMSFDALIQYLSLPVDQEKNIPLIRRALTDHPRLEYLSPSESGNGKESFKYRPLHPVTSGDELKLYLQRQPTAQGIPVRELKDGWLECNAVIDQLEKEGWVLVTRNKKDNTPKFVWKDAANWHLTISQDFSDSIAKTKMPATDGEMRNELEKAGLTVSSQVKETRKNDGKKKERKKPNRRGGKTTNSHMAHILKDYSRR